MSPARLTSLRIAGLRSLADVELRLDGLTVLVGENGTGKSSIVEALQIARSLPEPGFLANLRDIHGPTSELLRLGASALELEVGLRRDAESFRYAVRLVPHGAVWELAHERLDRVGDAAPLFRRDGTTLLSAEGQTSTIAADQPYLSYFGANVPHPWLASLIEALQGIEVHVPFRTTAAWVSRATRQDIGVRGAVMVAPASVLHLLGRNLVEAYQALRNRGRHQWDETLDLLRLGLGPRLSDVTIDVVARGYGELSVDFDGIGRIPAAALSDGQLSFLAFVAMARLDRGRSLLAFDEPELHLHPGLVVRVVQLFEMIAEQHPVILCTQSDRLLDALHDPVHSTAVCELGPHGDTCIRRLDAGRLAPWLQRFRGLGELRAEGDLELVLEDDARYGNAG